MSACWGLCVHWAQHPDTLSTRSSLKRYRFCLFFRLQRRVTIPPPLSQPIPHSSPFLQERFQSWALHITRKKEKKKKRKNNSWPLNFSGSVYSGDPLINNSLCKCVRHREQYVWGHLIKNSLCRGSPQQEQSLYGVVSPRTDFVRVTSLRTLCRGVSSLRTVFVRVTSLSTL